MEAALGVKGQATIPKGIRQHLHLQPGDRIKFFVHPDGSVVILPKLPASSLKGLIPPGRRRAAAVSLDEMEEAVAAGATAGNASAGRR